MSNERSRTRIAPRLVVLALGAACLLAGLDAALVRLSLPALVTGAELAALHGPLMLVGFLGTVISLERAVAARASWAYAAPAASALGCLLLLAGAPQPVGRALLVISAAALCAIYLRVHRRAPAPAVDVEAMGALALLLGNLLWLRGFPLETVVPLWLLLPTLTIVGERLELARVAFLDPAVEALVRALSAAAVLGACFMVVWPTARLATGPALAGLAVVMAYHDVARRTIRADGGVRFMAASMLAGYAWLAVAGLTWSLWGFTGLAGAGYEIIVHAIAVGYAFSMILAHAPVIIPAIVHRRLAYHRAMWVPYALLHAGMAVRVGGLIADSAGIWQAGGALGVAAILVFMALSLTRVVTSGGIASPGGRPGGPLPGRRAAAGGAL
ncbi:hypothetical protein [Actinomyces slackii]|uniref:hypothetical protein n=1 Tax=Actinomyces slackii TaxID=52774 RepID=UPI000408DB63|nr:hypothetical protein [Actinomyces slackii]